MEVSRYPWQAVELYVTSSVLGPEQLEAVLAGLQPDSVQVALNGVCSAVWDSQLAPAEPVAEHLRALWDTALEVFPALARLEPESVECGVSITQRMSPTDEVGPGFHIESGWVKVLAEAGGEIDVDLYVDYPED